MKSAKVKMSPMRSEESNEESTQSMRTRSKGAQNTKFTDARRQRFRICELKPWIASALLPVCVECSDEIKI